MVIVADGDGVVVDQDTSEDFEEELTLSERALEILRPVPTRHALEICEHLLGRGFHPNCARQAGDLIDRLDSVASESLTSRKRWYAVSLLKKWATTVAEPSDDYRPRSQLVALGREGLEGLVSCPEIYSCASRLLTAPSSGFARTSALHEDLGHLGRKAKHFGGLPAEVKKLFSDLVDETIDFNRKAVSDEGMKRYYHLGDVAGSLEPFCRGHNRDVYRLVRKVMEKDTDMILFDMYSKFAEVGRYAPRELIDVFERILDFIPEGSAMVDDEVKQVVGFIDTVADCLRTHHTYEITTFFNIYRKVVKHSDFFRPFNELRLLLEDSIRHRTFANKRHQDLHGKIPPSSSVVLDDTGLEYLKLSYDLRKESSKEVSDFARYVRSLDHLDMPEQREALDLYKIAVLQEEDLEESNADKFRNYLVIEKRKEADRKTLDDLYYDMIRKGPEPCPGKLKAHLKREFGVDVEEVWDLRAYQGLLYFSVGAVRTYEHLSSGKTDPDFFRLVAQVMDEWGLIQPTLKLSLQGCGSGYKEMLFAKELMKRHTVYPALNDESSLMLELALTNFRKEGIRPGYTRKDMRDLETEDVYFDGQVGMTLFGGTLLNLPKRDDFLRNLRQAVEDLPYPELFWLAVHGDTKKNRAYYERRLAKLFLARGLHKSCRLEIASLVRDGRLCHTSYFDPLNYELQCMYLITKDQPPFRKDQVVRVIDSGTLHQPSFRRDMQELGYAANFIQSSDRKSAVAVCTLLEDSQTHRF